MVGRLPERSHSTCSSVCDIAGKLELVTQLFERNHLDLEGRSSLRSESHDIIVEQLHDVVAHREPRQSRGADC